MLEVFDSFVKSEHDKCNYRLITLPNKLQAMLVSDPKLEKASAALDVHIGFFADPDEIPGLAHFLEHLLFMGTEKYPKENEYSQYLNENGGYSNAYTCEEHTNYFFDVNPDGLYGALDRFAQFFIAPLFDPSGTEREMRAVDSEHKKNLKNDHWRLNQLDKHLASPSHPYHKFGTGSLETLNVPGIRETLIAFHERFYSANLMKLVVFGRETLDQLQEWVVELFSAVRSNESAARPEWPGLPFDPTAEDFKRAQLVCAKTLKEMRSLSVSWLIPDQRPHYRTKPEHYLTHLIGHEGEGSLFQALKKRGWLTGLSAGCESDAHGYSFFQVSIELSPTGWQEYEQVLAWLAHYITALRRWGPQERIFKECQNLSSLAFQFREKGDPSSFTHQLATWMHQFSHDPRLMLAGPFITEVYDGDCISALLAHLTPERMRVTLASSAVEAADTEDGELLLQQEPWYGTEYCVSPLPPLERLNADDINDAELFLPGPNPFIPERLGFSSACSSDVPPVRKPVHLLDEAAFSLWHKLDDTFELPKSQVNVFFRSGDGLISSTPQRSQSASLFKDLLKHTLILYDATLAGLKYDFAVLAEGFEIKISGFSDKIPVLLETILQAILKPAFSVVDFEVIRDRQLRSLQNFPREAPYWHASFHLNGLIAEPFHSIQDRIAVLQHMDASEMTATFNAPGFFVNEISNCGPVEMLVHGSLDEQDARDLAQLLRASLSQQQQQMSQPSAWRQRIIQLPRGETVYCPPSSSALDNPNCAVEVFFAVGSLEDVRLRTLAALFAQVFSESFFDALRTNEQLGYIVTHGLREKGVLCGLRFLIQSERHPQFLDSRIEAFLDEHVASTLENMSHSALQQHCTALRLELTQKKKTLAAEAKVYWEAILSGSCDFERAFRDAELLDGVSVGVADLKDFYETFLKAGGRERRKLCVQVWSAAMCHEKDQDRQEGTVHPIITDRNEFVKSCQFYPETYAPAN